MSKKMTAQAIGQAMREGIREELLGKRFEELPPGWFNIVKRFSGPRLKHELKKKFLNEEEAMWWVGENPEKNPFPVRAYRCHACPFWHLTTKRKW